MVSAWPLQSGISDQVSKWLQIFLHLSSVTQFLGARYGNHKKLWPFANITSSSAISSEINYSRLSTFSQRWDFSCQQRGTVEVGTLFQSWRIRGFHALQSVQTKNGREKQKKSDAGVDVQSKIFLWSWTFSCDVGNKDPDSCPGSKQTWILESITSDSCFPLLNQPFSEGNGRLGNQPVISP